MKIRKVASSLFAVGALGVGVVAPVVTAPTANAYIECGPAVIVFGAGGQRCADHRPDGSVWWRDWGCFVVGCAWGPWYPAPPPGP